MIVNRILYSQIGLGCFTFGTLIMGLSLGGVSRPPETLEARVAMVVALIGAGLLSLSALIAAIKYIRRFRYRLAGAHNKAKFWRMRGESALQIGVLLLMFAILAYGFAPIGLFIGLATAGQVVAPFVEDR